MNILGVSERIRQSRGGLTQTEFAKLIGVSQGTVQKYEKGGVLPGDETLKKIADHGGVTVEYLLRGEEAKPTLREEPAPLTKPEPGAPALIEPYLFAHVDRTVLAEIIEIVEEGLKRKKRPTGSKRKSHLISLLYDEWQKTGRLPDKSTIWGFIDMI